MPYTVPNDARCDDCQAELTEAEREVNAVENEDQDGNSLWCTACRAEWLAEAAEADA